MTRTNFTPATKRKIKERSSGTCEVHRIPECMRAVWYRSLPLSCNRAGQEVDHVTPDSVKGPATVENGAFLCKPCHAIKTAEDTKNAARSKRRAGETGQQARRKRNGSKIQSRGFEQGKRAIPSRPFQKRNQTND